jgi:hypothetical protein
MLQRVQKLVEATDTWVRDKPQRKQRELCIITGVGKHSKEQQNTLQAEAMHVLGKLGIKAEQNDSNAGRLVVAADDLSQCIQQLRQQQERSKLLHEAGIRYLAVAGFLISIGGFGYLVPRILAHT